MEGFFAFFLILILIVLLGILYKQRHVVARWLNDTNLTVTDAKRKKNLLRTIEDAQEEIREIERREARKSKAETGDE